MKYLKFTALATIVLIFITTSCSKDKKEYCAVCMETTTGQKADDFCGNEEDVDTYINELKSTEVLLGLSWNCSKK